MFTVDVVRRVIEQQVNDLENLWAQKYPGFAINDVLDSMFETYGTYITYDASCDEYELMNVQAFIVQDKGETNLLCVQLFADCSCDNLLEMVYISAEEIEIEAVGPFNPLHYNYKGGCLNE